jgi:hypothetical protein
MLSPTEKGEANRYQKAEREAKMWKEECAKANRRFKRLPLSCRRSKAPGFCNSCGD